MRLMYACSELGLGHASRTIALGKKLEQRGHEIFFFSGGKAYQLLKKEFKSVYPTTPVGWYENSSGIIISASLINIFFPLPYFNSDTGKFETKNPSAIETIHRYYDLRQPIYKIKPDIIIADGDIHALRLAHRWKIPAVYITNVVRPTQNFSLFLNPGERLTELYVRGCKKIIIPDNPPPNTICEYNIGDLRNVGVLDKTEYVGTFFDVKPTCGNKKYVFAPVSGPLGTRSKLLQMLIPTLQEIKGESVVSLGVPNERKTGRVSNCKIYTWLSPQQREEFMRNASIVVFSGGHITCFETVKYAKPSVLIPTQPEQTANAIKLQNMGCSLIATRKTQLKLAIQRIEEKYDMYKNRIETLNSISNKYNGLKRAVEIIEETKN
ncbi:MAG: hypothetical protein N3D85_00885 [Candidatus Bathyarchaeota archaeon]|nr:hypothetical protein [Candidatus Bathyarchaeota archaeon]